MRTLARRSIQTIKNRTQVVSSFVDQVTENKFFVRRLSDRVSPARQLFIITINDTPNDGDVIPFAEIAMNNDKMRYVVKPTNQYPQFAIGSVIDKVEAAIASYMKNVEQFNYH